MLIATATSQHTEVSLPDGYQYVETGSALKENHVPGILRDDDGISLSEKNRTYCELTVLYWLWKNRTDDIRGLCHYRRLFSNDTDVKIFTIEMKKIREIDAFILKKDQIQRDLKNHDMILLMPYNPGDHTAREDLKRYLYEKDIDILDQVMARYFPEYLDAYLDTMHSCNLSYCNMFIAGKEVFDAYCTWLFAVLFTYEKKVDLSGYDAQHRRIFGYVSEVLQNVWVRKNRIHARYYNLLGVGDYWQKPKEQFKYDGFKIVENMVKTAPGRVSYETLLKTVKNRRYENYRMLKKNFHDGEAPVDWK